MSPPDQRPVDPAGVLAAGLACVLLIVQAQTFNRTFGVPTSVVVLVLWQLGVVLFTGVGAVARSVRLRVTMYVLGGLGAFLYGLLTWSFAGVIDLVVAVAAGWGVVRAVIPLLRPMRREET